MKASLKPAYAIVILLILITIFGLFIPKDLYEANYVVKNGSPALSHIFGTDFFGRDMFFLTLKGLSISIIIGLFASLISSIIALILGFLSAMLGGVVDEIINWLIDLFMGIPHIMLLILISIMCGGGLFGVIIGISLTHWPSLARVIRAEILQIREKPYIKSAKKFGKGDFYIASTHIFPHVLPQYLVGLILLFPHAILHEAAITFLGFGLGMDTPAIGNILSNAMKYLSMGEWYLAFFPGFMLMIAVLSFDFIANKFRNFLNSTNG